MQLIVNISKKLYREVKDRSVPSGYNANDCYDAIWKGIPLPEGHGRLVDEKDLSLMTVHLIDGKLVCDAPTIVGADKEGVWSDK